MAKKKVIPKLNIAQDDPGNIGAFVTKSYGKQSIARQQAIYNRLRSQGAEFTDNLNPLTPEMAGQKPEGYNTPDVGGPFKVRPNYDKSKFNLLKNRYGRYFLERINELSGLNAGERGQVTSYDDISNRQNERINKSYSDAASAISADAARTSAQMEALKSMRGEQLLQPGGQPTPAGGGEGVSQAALLAQQTAASQAAQEKVRATVQATEDTTNRAADPNIVRQAMANASAQYLAQRGQGRTSLVNTLQGQRAQREYQDKVLKNQQLAAKNTLLAAVATQQGLNSRAELASKTELAKVKLQLTSAENREIARLNAQGTQKAKDRAQKIKDAAQKRGDDAAKEALAYAKSELVQGDSKWVTVTNPDGTKEEIQQVSGSISPDKLIRTLLVRYRGRLSANDIRGIVAQAYPGMGQRGFDSLGLGVNG